MATCTNCGHEQEPVLLPGALAGGEVWVCEKCANTNIIQVHEPDNPHAPLDVTGEPAP